MEREGQVFGYYLEGDDLECEEIEGYSSLDEVKEEFNTRAHWHSSLVFTDFPHIDLEIIKARLQEGRVIQTARTHDSDNTSKIPRVHPMRTIYAILIFLGAILFLPESTRSTTDSEVNCPSCSMTMFWTGETTTEWGKMFKLYKCPAGHMYWIPWDQIENEFSPRRRNDGNDSELNQVTPKCPVCGMDAYWTGKTRTEWGKLQKIYKCPAGHYSVGNF